MNQIGKQKGAWAYRGGKLGKSKYVGKLMENKGYFSKVYLCRSAPSVSGNKGYFPLPSTEERGHLYK